MNIQYNIQFSMVLGAYVVKLFYISVGHSSASSEGNSNKDYY